MCRGWTKNNGNTRQYRNKTVCVGCTEPSLVVSIFHYSFVCLHCVVPVSMQHRFCLVTVCMKELKIGGLSDFQRGQIVGACLVGASVTKTTTVLGVCRAVYDSICRSWEGIII